MLKLATVSTVRPDDRPPVPSCCAGPSHERARRTAPALHHHDLLGHVRAGPGHRVPQPRARAFPTPTVRPELVRVATEAIAAGRNQYPPEPGRARAAGRRRRASGVVVRARRFSPEDEVLVTTGATEAIAASFLALCEPGDEVVMFEPSYDSYAACASMAGAVPRLVRLHPPDWSFDAGELAAAIGPRTRLLLLNSPAQSDRQGVRAGRAGADRRALLRPRHPGGDRRGLRAPRVRRHPRPPGHPARDGRADPLHLLGRQDLLLHRVEGGLGERHRRRWSPRCGRPSSSSPTPPAPPSSWPSRTGSASSPPRINSFGRGVAGQARPVLRRLGKARLHRVPPGRDVLRHHRHRERGPRHGRVRLLPRPARTLRCGGHPQLGVLRAPAIPARGGPSSAGPSASASRCSKRRSPTRLVELIAVPARRARAPPAPAKPTTSMKGTMPVSLTWVDAFTDTRFAGNPGRESASSSAPLPADDHAVPRRRVGYRRDRVRDPHQRARHLRPALVLPAGRDRPVRPCHPGLGPRAAGRSGDRRHDTGDVPHPSGPLRRLVRRAISSSSTSRPTP